MKTTELDELATEKISMRLPPTLKERIAKAAKEDGRKPSQWIVHQLSQLLGELGGDAPQGRVIKPLVPVESDTTPERQDQAK